MTPTLTPSQIPTSAYPTPGRRFGYAVAIALNGFLLYAVRHLLEWEWPAFLTHEFEDTLPAVSASIVATIAVNVVYLGFDPRWLRSLGDAIAAAFAFVASYRLFAVFPFDFQSYAFDWGPLVRGTLIIAMVGTAIAAFVGMTKAMLTPFRAMRS